MTIPDRSPRIVTQGIACGQDTFHAEPAIACGGPNVIADDLDDAMQKIARAVRG